MGQFNDQEIVEADWSKKDSSLSPDGFTCRSMSAVMMSYSKWASLLVSVTFENACRRWRSFGSIKFRQKGFLGSL